MAIRTSRRIRSVVTGLAALGAAALLIPSLASATPTQPGSPPNTTPVAPQSVATVQQQLGKLAFQNTMLVEQYDQAQVKVAADQKAADVARREAVSAAADFDTSRAQLSRTVATRYEGGAFSTTGALLSSPDGASYLDQLNTLGIMSAHIAQVVAHLNTAQKVSTAAQQRAASLLATATARRDALGKKKDAVQQQVDKYTTLLATLNSAQRAAFQRSITPPVAHADVATAVAGLKAPGVSKLARIAVQFALAQVGKPYVFGAAGPDSYDCSGLTMAAWGAAGVALPHSAADQFNYGTHVSMSQLQPGDLVFMYQPIGHVEIYIGGGQLVSAPQSGENVSVIPLNNYAGEFTGATRLP